MKNQLDHCISVESVIHLEKPLFTGVTGNSSVKFSGMHDGMVWGAN